MRMKKFLAVLLTLMMVLTNVFAYAQTEPTYVAPEAVEETAAEQAEEPVEEEPTEPAEEETPVVETSESVQNNSEVVTDENADAAEETEETRSGRRNPCC